MIRKHKSFLIGLFVSLLVILPVLFSLRSPAVSINGTKVLIARAITEHDRRLGLGEYEKLKENHGMLFEFEDADYYGIWMKDVEFPIDVIWLDKNKIVIDIESNMQPESYPTVFKPEKPALYVLEVPAGFAVDNKIKRGQSAEFNF